MTCDQWDTDLADDLHSEFSRLLGGDASDEAVDLATDLVAVVEQYWPTERLGEGT